MKVLVILGFANPFAGAAWTRIDSLAKSWSKKGHIIDVLGTFTPKTFQKKGAAKYGPANIFNIIPNVNPNSSILFFVNNTLSFFITLLFLLIRRPKIAVISVPGNGTEIGAISASLLVDCKCVIDYRDEWEEYAITCARSKNKKSFYSMVKHFAGLIYRKCNLVVTVTPNCKIALEQRGLVNIKLIPNGADTNTFKPLPIKNNNQFKLFYSGGGGQYYRLDIVLKALKAVVDWEGKDIVLTIVGSGKVDKVLDMASQLGVSQYVEYKGVINDKTQLANLIAQANIGLIPYDDNPLWKNALPAKFFEYCACGVPIIATVDESSILAVLITTNKIGLIAPPLNVEMLTDCIRRFYSDGKFRKSTGSNARQLIVDQYDRTRIAEEYNMLIEGMV